MDTSEFTTTPIRIEFLSDFDRIPWLHSFIFPFRTHCHFNSLEGQIGWNNDSGFRFLNLWRFWLWLFDWLRFWLWVACIIIG
jgi:hypothetical protein